MKTLLNTIKATINAKVENAVVKLTDIINFAESHKHLAKKASLPVTEDYIAKGIITNMGNEFSKVGNIAGTFYILECTAYRTGKPEMAKNVKRLNYLIQWTGSAIVMARGYNSYRELQRIEKNEKSVVEEYPLATK